MDGRQLQPDGPQDGEPAAAYERYLFYRNLGRGRSLKAAYRAAMLSVDEVPSEHLPGLWKRDSVEYNWPARAKAHDIAVLQEQGREAVLNVIAALSTLSQKVIEALQELPNPETLAECLDALKLLTAIIPDESLAAMIEESQRRSDQVKARV